MLLEEQKKDINKSPKEMQEKMDQKVETLTKETQKSFKETQENMGQKIEANKEEMQKSLKEIQESQNSWDRVSPASTSTQELGKATALWARGELVTQGCWDKLVVPQEGHAAARDSRTN